MATLDSLTQYHVTGNVYRCSKADALDITSATQDISSLTSLEILGYLSEDGITVNPTKDVTGVKAWQNNAMIRYIATGGEPTIAFTALDITDSNLKAYYENNVDENGAYVFDTSKSPDFTALVLDGIDKETKKQHRIVAWQASISDMGELKIGGGDVMRIPFTYTLTNLDEVGSFKHFVGSTVVVSS